MPKKKNDQSIFFYISREKEYNYLYKRKILKIIITAGDHKHYGANLHKFKLNQTTFCFLNEIPRSSIKIFLKHDL